MNDRKTKILRQLASQNFFEEDIKSKLGITKRQLDYSIHQINEDLKHNNIPIIYKENGRYIVDENITRLLLQEIEEPDIIYTPNERIILLILYFLLSKETLSLNHLAMDLNVSKNTVLNDIKLLREELMDYDLELLYSRESGYKIIGDEFDIRILLQNVILDCLSKYTKDVFITYIAPFDLSLNSIKDYIHQIEKFLNLKFIDDDYYNLVFTFAVAQRRIEKSKLVRSFDYVDFREITTTEEYQVIKLVVAQMDNLNEAELIYWSLQLLSARKRDTKILMKEDIPLLSNALWEFLNELEVHALISIQNKKELLKKLVLHFKPAYYRIKYNLHVKNILHEEIIDKYTVLHNFVCQSIDPLEQFFKMKIPNQELSYITLFIGGHILSEDQVETEGNIIKAVILCPNGITMSKILEKNLKQLFPEFVFYPSLSLREYEGFILPHDIVFSTVPVSTGRKLFIVNQLLNNSSKIKLRQEVIKRIYNIDFFPTDIKSIINVVKKHATIHNEDNLLKDLDQLLIGEHDSTEHYDVMMSSNTLFTEDHIQILDEKMTFDCMLEVSCQPLIKSKLIDENYLSQIKKEYNDQPSYIVLRNKLSLPHLNPDLTDQKLGVSIVINKAGYRYNNQTLYVMILLTTPDKTSHLDALFIINKLAKNSELFQQLENIDTPKEVLNIIEKIN